MKIKIIVCLFLFTFLRAGAETWTDSNGVSWTFTVSGSDATDIKPTDNSISGAIVIPSRVSGTYTVRSIAIEAFYNCTGMTSVTIPSSITSIATDAFYRCDGLTKVIVQDIAAWCNISFGAYYANPLKCAHHLYSDANTEITQLVIPSGVTSIANSAFIGCTGLTSVTIPEGVTSIGEEAFMDCSNLASITTPNSLTDIGDDAFKNTALLNNQTGVVYLGNIAYKYAGTMPANTEVVIREGTTFIAPSAFQFCANLISISIPSSVTTIGERAFQSCDGLTNVVIPEGVTTIGNYAFLWSEGLTSVSIPSTLTIINRSTFAHCTSLTSVTIPEGVTSIGLSAFDGCTSLTSASIPSTVTSIDDEAFYGCSSLTSVYNYSTTPQSITSDAFTNRRNATLYVPAGCSSAYRAADYWKDFLTVSEISEDVEWVNIARNGDLEGSAICCYYSKEPVGTNAGKIVPATFVEGVGKDNTRGIVLQSIDNQENDWDTQFFIRLPQTLPAGTKYHITFDYKATKSAEVSTQTHENPGEYIFWYGIGDISFTTGWQHFELTSTISEDQSTTEKPMRTFAFNLAKEKTATTYYFDNIVVEIDKPHCTFLLGDVNGDGIVDVTDYTSVANYIHSNIAEGFIFDAGDIDGNIVIDVTDYTGIANIIHTGSPNGEESSGAKAATIPIIPSGESDELDPQ